MNQDEQAVKKTITIYPEHVDFLKKFAEIHGCRGKISRVIQLLIDKVIIEESKLNSQEARNLYKPALLR